MKTISIEYQKHDAIKRVHTEIFDNTGKVVGHKSDETMAKERKFYEGKIFVRCVAIHEGKMTAVESNVSEPRELKSLIAQVGTMMAMMIADKLANEL